MDNKAQNILNTCRKLYKETTTRLFFDINAGQELPLQLTPKEMINYINNHVAQEKKGCCFHASLYLMGKLHERGIKSNMIITLEPVIENGQEIRKDNRASVLVEIDGEKIVMNPIEDIEYFEKYNIPPKNRASHYEGEATEFIPVKEGINSTDAGNIPYDDFVLRYGNGEAYIVKDLFANEAQDKSISEILSTTTKTTVPNKVSEYS